MSASRFHPRSTPRRSFTLGLSAALALAIAGCPGELEDPERFMFVCPDITGGLFADRCVGSGCHNAIDLAGGLDLASPGVESRLIGVEASDSCSGTLVDPSSPTASVLYRKLIASACGAGRMPANGVPLTDAELECVRAWIAGLTPGPSSSSSSGEL